MSEWVKNVQREQVKRWLIEVLTLKLNNIDDFVPSATSFCAQFEVPTWHKWLLSTRFFDSVMCFRKLSSARAGRTQASNLFPRIFPWIFLGNGFQNGIQAFKVWFPRICPGKFMGKGSNSQFTRQLKSPSPQESKMWKFGKILKKIRGPPPSATLFRPLKIFFGPPRGKKGQNFPFKQICQYFFLIFKGP